MRILNLRRKKGFTFIEVLVSSVILMIVLAEMLGGFSGGRLLSRKSRDRLVAMGFAREKLEQLLALGYDGLNPWLGEHTDTISDQDFVRRTGAWRVYRTENIPAAAGPTKIYYRRVSVVVKWKFLRNDVIYTEALSSLIYNPNYTP